MHLEHSCHFLEYSKKSFLEEAIKIVEIDYQVHKEYFFSTVCVWLLTVGNIKDTLETIENF